MQDCHFSGKFEQFAAGTNLTATLNFRIINIDCKTIEGYSWEIPIQLADAKHGLKINLAHTGTNNLLIPAYC